VLLNLRVVHKTKFRTDLRRALVFPEHNHFHVRMEQFPTLQRVPLDNPVMPSETFRGRKKCQHAS
jgi:hypothetical protein